MRLFIYHALAIALGSDLDVFEMIDENENKPTKGSRMKTLNCGECGGRSTEVSDKFFHGKLLSRPLFWRKCNSCHLVSEAVTKKKKTLRKWNELSLMIFELKKRQWTA